MTPYVEQERLLRDALAEDVSIVVGTAHKFQGDERDIMILSPVLSPGLSEGSLGWLDRTANLLNVAVTRARLTLIVVGNWEFCAKLPPDNKYRRLADYVARDPNRVVRNISSIPFFGEAFDIVGALVDPTNPDYCRTTLRRFIASCKDYVWWIDPYLNDRVFNLLWDIFQTKPTNLSSVRLLTSSQQVTPDDGSRPQISKDKFRSLKDELRRQGIEFSIRSLPLKQLPHDRLLYAGGQAVNMPPFSMAYGDHKRLSEYTQSRTTHDLFEKYWNSATEVLMHD